MPRQLRTRAQLTEASKPPRQAMSDRPHRAVTKQQKDPDSSPLSTITVARESSSSPVAGRKSIKLTLKMAPSKLREVTMGSTARSTSTVSRDSLEPSTRASGPRASRAKRAVVIDSGSDGDDDEEEEEDESDDEQSDVDDEGVIAQREEDDAGEDEERGEEDDAEGEEDEDEEEEEGEEEEEEEEEEDADGDADVDMEDMDAAPPPPVIQRIGPSSNPKLMVTPAPTKGHIRSVEAKEIQMANDAASDEDLSELPDDEDAEGEDVAEDEAMVDADEDAEGDSDDDLSRDGTPDMTKLTKRQRARIGEEGSEHFMSLNMGKHSPILISVIVEQLGPSLLFRLDISSSDITHVYQDSADDLPRAPDQAAFD